MGDSSGFSNALKYFQNISETVPAYKKFLKSHRINPKKIRTPEDYRKIPYIDKKNYLRAYPFHELFQNGKIPGFVSTSSGSSGVPFYWPRGEELHIEGAHIHKNIFTDIFGIQKKKTLVLMCFSMGMWVAGSYTILSLNSFLRKKGGMNVSITTPGIDIEDALNILRQFAGNFESIIIAGYPPFIMDLVDIAQSERIDFSRWDTHFLFAGENFSETWRESLYKLANVESTLDRSVSIYGTADAGIIGHENQATIATLKTKIKNNGIIKNKERVPTLVQYYPKYKYCEVEDDELIFTAINSGIPLVRYNIHDRCSIFTPDSFRKLSEEVGVFEEHPELKKTMYYKNPVIALYGRDDISAVFYGLNIYPENIKYALEEKKMSKIVTGKFLIEVKTLQKGKKQILCIHLELRRGVIEKNNSRKKKIENEISLALQEVNAEYRKLCEMMGARSRPKVFLYQFGEKLFRIRKSKLPWVNKKTF